jgi:hypothetical protein
LKYIRHKRKQNPKKEGDIMKRINIKDLQNGQHISKEEMKKVLGGIGTWPTPERLPFSYGPISRYISPRRIETVPLPE